MFLERINGRMSIDYERIEIVMKTQAAYGLASPVASETIWLVTPVTHSVTWDVRAGWSGDMVER